jgi:ribose-phosphate pyrophosphokinase
MLYLRLHEVLEDVRQDQTIEFERLRFNGGENHIKLKIPKEGFIRRNVRIEAKLTNSDYVMELLLATDALRQAGAVNIQLVAPYIPYGRQDRVMVPGEPLSIKVMADLINAQNYTHVWTLDNHSDVTTALLNNCRQISNKRIISRFIMQGRQQELVFISVDAGSVKKTFKLLQRYGGEMIIASKVRDVTSGQIVRTKVHIENLHNATCLIFDDICDGGRSFIELAKVLKQKNAGAIHLYTSHGIYPHGIDSLLENIDSIRTTNCFRLDCETKNWKNFKVLRLRKEDLV